MRSRYGGGGVGPRRGRVAAGREAPGQRRRDRKLVADKATTARGGPADEELRRPQLYSGEAAEGAAQLGGVSEQQQAVYQNRPAGAKRKYGKSLLKRRGEWWSAALAHCYETGRAALSPARRAEHPEAQLIHVGAFNLS